MDHGETDVEYLAEAKQTLTELLGYSDELPEQFIIGDPNYQKHKFRTNWFQGALSNIEMVADILNDQQLKQDATSFRTEKKAKEKNARATREEINYVDQLIRRALQKLENGR